VEEGAVRTGADLVDDVGLKIGVDGTGDILALTSLGEEGAEAVVVVQGLALLGEETIGLDTVLEAVELPARVCNLATGLADVQTDDFSLVGLEAE
jgi:hypothetical protein